MSRLFKIVLAITLLSCGSAFAQEPVQEPVPSGPDKDHLPINASKSESDDTGEVGLVDRTHSLVSERFNSFIYQIDDTLSGGEPVSAAPQSSARVRLDFSKRGNDSTSLKGKIRVRAVLPRSERRLRLLIESDEDLKPEGESLSDDDSEGLSFALRFIRSARDKGYLNLDLGARWRESQVQVFGRANLALDFFHGREQGDDSTLGFHSKFTNSLFHFSASGFENRFRYDLSKTLDERDSLLLRASTDILWSDSRNGALFTETLGLYTDIDENRALAFELRASYSTRLNGEETDHFRGSEVRFRFRHNIWRKWFYYEFWPGITWFAEDNYRQTFQGLFRVETVIGKF